ncbi:class I SAM-dependent methyltransferase [Streptomyces sp. NPDC056178]|uniref:class I SAM-dependent methyltransferase n=1 Tax=unclassified Streptomyces TaxID=2593676 RepID=UPI0035DE5837
MTETANQPPTGNDEGSGSPAACKSPQAYWEPLWTQGRRYRQLDNTETRLLAEHLGPGRGRPALDIGSGEGTLARHLHHSLGYRTTGIDCSPGAIALAAAQDTGPGPCPAWRCMDITADDPGSLPDPAYAVITCRLVYRWIADQPAFVDRVRRLLAPGGTFWVVAEIAGRREDTSPLQHLGITAAQAETLTAGWSVVRTADLDVLRCYALRP